jgi:hypothetical protein
MQGRVGERLMYRGLSRVGSQECAEWKLIEIDNKSVQEQHCVGEVPIVNRITIDANGEIIKIEQYLGTNAHSPTDPAFKSLGSSATITLTKLKL